MFSWSGSEEELGRLQFVCYKNLGKLKSTVDLKANVIKERARPVGDNVPAWVLSLAASAPNLLEI